MALSEFDILDALERLTIHSIKNAQIYSYGVADAQLENVWETALRQIEALKGFFRRSVTSGASVLVFLA